MNGEINSVTETYNVDGWGDGYFYVSEKGRLHCRPDPVSTASIDLYQIVHDVKEQHGVSTPLLVRFPGILQHRLCHLNSTFEAAIKAAGYRGQFCPVYPIKVNQQRRVVEGLVETKAINVGMEAGSKAELLVVMGVNVQQQVKVICNGFKDEAYIRLALVGVLLKQDITIVIERLEELSLVIRLSKQLGIKPKLGLRARLFSVSSGQWQNSGGVNSKFGLSAIQLVAAVNFLKASRSLDYVSLLHFHVGSQVADLADIKQGLQEGAKTYQQLCTLGVPLDSVDVGGGLGVDYEGSNSARYFSMNYSVEAYADCVVRAFGDMCDENKLPHPNIVTECGRAMTAHHAVLITNVISQEVVADEKLGLVEQLPSEAIKKLDDLSVGSCINTVDERYQKLQQLMYHHHALFLQGELTLEQHAVIEVKQAEVGQQLAKLVDGKVPSIENCVERALKTRAARNYFCNFSVFKSMPDVWAINQLFPIMPLHRLNEPPTEQALLKDITCDSDGRIDDYISSAGLKATLPLHQLEKDNAYYLGVFLVGAYQEILGDIHNLFGETHAVDVNLLDDGGYSIEHIKRGQTVESVVRQVGFNAKGLVGALQKQVKSGDLSETAHSFCQNQLAAVLGSYTYPQTS